LIRGCPIEFDGPLPLQRNWPPQIKFSSDEEELMNTAIIKLLDKGVLEKCFPIGEQFISNVFSVPKPDNSRRLILNLKKLNSSVEYKKFKMDTLVSILRLVQPNCFMGCLDIRDAYYSVNIRPSNRCYLRFLWRNSCLQYTCLPNGLSSAPRIFTKIMKVPLAFLRERGHIVSGYIDDIYVQGDSWQTCKNSLQETWSLLESLGFVMHTEKSSSVPVQQAKVLGFIIDSINMTVTLTSDKVQKTKLLAEFLLGHRRLSIRVVAKFIGRLVSSFPAVQWGKLHYRNLERRKIQALKRCKGNFDANMIITEDMIMDIKWWYHNLDMAFDHIYRDNPQETVQCDASLEGWGAICHKSTTGGRFSVQDKILAPNINALELLAIKFALLSFVNVLCNKHVLIKTDNTTAVSYIKDMGGMKSLVCNKIAVDIWTWAKEHNIWLSITHLPGVDNVDADNASRIFNDRTEWSLDQKFFNKIITIFGPLEVDLFASRLNNKLPVYYAWKPDPYATGIDAFTISWSNINFYCFPPFSLISRCLRKISADQAEGVIVVPWWPTQVWFPLLGTLLMERPRLLPVSKKVISLPHNSMKPPLKARYLVCKLSGRPTKAKEFHQKWLESYVPRGGKTQRNNIQFMLEDGLSLLGKRVVIPFLHL